MVAKKYLLKLYIHAGWFEDAKCLTEEFIQEHSNAVDGNRYLLLIAFKSGNINDLRALLKNTKFKDDEFKLIVHIVLRLPNEELQENCLLDVVKSFETAEFFCLLVMIALDRGMKKLLLVGFSEYVSWYRSLSLPERDQDSGFHEKITEYIRREVRRVLLLHLETQSSHDDLPDITQLAAALTFWADQKGSIPETNSHFFEYLGYQVSSIRIQQGIPIHLSLHYVSI